MNKYDVAGTLNTYAQKAKLANNTKQLKDIIRDLKSELDLRKIEKIEEKQNRKNPNYPPWYQGTFVLCEKCGEAYEPCCKYEHKCKKQNSYPVGQ